MYEILVENSPHSSPWKKFNISGWSEILGLVTPFDANQEKFIHKSNQGQHGGSEHSNSCLKRKSKNAENGPTEKKMREEELNKKTSKTAKGAIENSSSEKVTKKFDKNSKNDKNSKDKDVSSSISHDKISNISKDKTSKKSKVKDISSKKSKVNTKKNSKVKTSKESKDKIEEKLYDKVASNESKRIAKIKRTEGNINSFVLETRNTKSKDEFINMLLFTFKHSKTNPAEIFVRIIILTSVSKIENKDEKIHDLILKLLFKYLKSKELF